MIGFGENVETTGESVQNKMKAVNLYGSASATSALSVIPMTDDVKSFAEQGGNARVQLVYCPVKELEYNTSVTTGQTYSLVVDIKSSVQTAMDNYSSYSAKLDDFFATEDYKNKYGEGLDKFVLQVNLPDLSDGSALTVTSEWSVK